MKDLREFAEKTPNKTIEFVTGSHLYGLNTSQSDIDKTILVMDFHDLAKPFPELPDSKQYDNNDVKYYNFKYFVQLLVKGNPNLVELVYESTGEFKYSGEFSFMTAFLKDVRPYVATQKCASAYYGHLNHVLGEIGNQEITPKRLSHFYRVAKSLQYFLKNQKIPQFRIDLPEDRQVAYEIKSSIQTFHPDQMIQLRDETDQLYKELKDTLPTSERLIDFCNGFFVDRLKR